MDDDEIGECDAVECRIDTGDARPIQQPLRRVPFKQREEIDEAVEELRKLGIIKESSSEWASPLVPVRKPNGKLRLCVDFRRLNEVTKPLPFPIPHSQDLLDRIGISIGINDEEKSDEWKPRLSKIDMKMGFHQLKLNETDAPKTAFRTHRGLYEYKRLPMGLSIAGAAFQRLMNHVLNGILNDGVFCYLDDVCIATGSIDTHIDRLAQVFERFQTAGLKLRPEKCEFLNPELVYLGHVITKKGLLPNPGNTDTISKYPRPSTQKQVRQFYGMASYFRRFIKDFAKIAAPLTALLSKDVQFIWTTETEAAFRELKHRLITPPVLHFPDPTKGRYYIETDGSKYGLGAVLGQLDSQKRLCPIAYGSRGLNRHEGNYAPSELEALACIFAVRKFRPYIWLEKVTIMTDHQALVYLLKQKEPAGRLHRWILDLVPYNIDWCYRKGPLNKVADALSRMRHVHDDVPNLGDWSEEYTPCPDFKLPYAQTCSAMSTRRVRRNSTPAVFLPNTSQETTTTQESESTVPQPQPESDINNSTAQQSEQMDIEPPDTQMGNYEIVREMQRADPELREIMSDLEQGKLLGKYVNTHYTLIDEILHMESQGSYLKVVPTQEREKLLCEHHSLPAGAHVGGKAMLARLKRQFFWPNMTQSVWDYCRSCMVCAARHGQGRLGKPFLSPLPIPSKTWERMGMDILKMPQSDNGNSYLLVMKDYLSKFLYAFPIPNEQAETVARTLVDRLFWFGIPREIVSDKGSAFISKLFQEIGKCYKIKQLFTTA
ncbi:MAG: DDE-type integrase/transposase/recombinase, partial [Gammaproteobacteria bacterium]|nr:DDE-type integrase/transposase/recombinase [Gammaproteobacteria bacterium]